MASSNTALDGFLEYAARCLPLLVSPLPSPLASTSVTAATLKPSSDSSDATKALQQFAGGTCPAVYLCHAVDAIEWTAAPPSSSCFAPLCAFVRTGAVSSPLSSDIPWPQQVQPIPLVMESGDGENALLKALHHHFSSLLQPVVATALAANAAAMTGSVKSFGSRNRVHTSAEVGHKLRFISNSLKALSRTSNVPQLTLDLPPDVAAKATAWTSIVVDDAAAARLGSDAAIVSSCKDALNFWTARLTDVISQANAQVQEERKLVEEQITGKQVVQYSDASALLAGLEWWDGMGGALRHAFDFFQNSVVASNCQKILKVGEVRLWPRFDAGPRSEVVGLLPEAEARCLLASPLLSHVQALVIALTSESTEATAPEIKLELLRTVAQGCTQVIEDLKRNKGGDGSLAVFSLQVLDALADAFYRGLLQCTEVRTSLSLSSEGVAVLSSEVSTGLLALSSAIFDCKLQFLDAARKKFSATAKQWMQLDGRIKQVAERVGELADLSKRHTSLNAFGSFLLEVPSPGGATAAQSAGASGLPPIYTLLALTSAEQQSYKQRIEQAMQQLYDAYALFLRSAAIVHGEQPVFLSVEHTELWNDVKSKYQSSAARIESTLAALVSDGFKKHCEILRKGLRVVVDAKAPKGIYRRESAAVSRTILLLWRELQRWTSSSHMAAALRPQQIEALNALNEDLGVIEARVRTGFSGSSDLIVAAAQGNPAVSSLLSWNAQMQRCVSGIATQVAAISSVSGSGAGRHEEAEALAVAIMKRCGDLRTRLDPVKVFAKWHKDISDAVLPFCEAASTPVAANEHAVGRRIFGIAHASVRNTTATSILDLHVHNASALPRHVTHRAYALRKALYPCFNVVRRGDATGALIMYTDFPHTLVDLLQEFQALTVLTQHSAGPVKSWSVTDVNAVSGASDALRHAMDSVIKADWSSNNLRWRWATVASRVEILYPIALALTSSLHALGAAESRLQHLASTTNNPLAYRLASLMSADARRSLQQLIQQCFRSFNDNILKVSWVPYGAAGNSTMPADAFAAAFASAVAAFANATKVSIDAVTALQQGDFSQRAALVARLRSAGVSPRHIGAFLHALELLQRSNDSKVCAPVAPPVLTVSIQLDTSLARPRVTTQPSISELRNKLHARIQPAPGCSSYAHAHEGVETMLASVTSRFQRWDTFAKLLAVPERDVIDLLGLQLQQETEANSASRPAAWHMRILDCLSELRDVVGNVNSSVTSEDFTCDIGIVSADFSDVASRVQQKLASLQQSVLEHYAGYLLVTTRGLCKQLKDARTTIDAANLDAHANKPAELVGSLGTIRDIATKFSSSDVVQRDVFTDSSRLPAAQLLLEALAANDTKNFIASLILSNSMCGRLYLVHSIASTIRSYAITSTDASALASIEGLLPAAWQEATRIQGILLQRQNDMVRLFSLLVDQLQTYISQLQSELSRIQQAWATVETATSAQELQRTMIQCAEISTACNKLSTHISSLKDVRFMLMNAGANAPTLIELVRKLASITAVDDLVAKLVALKSSISNTQQAWEHLIPLLTVLQQMRDMPFSDLVVKTARTTLDELKTAFTNLPSTVQTQGRYYDEAYQLVTQMRDTLNVLSEMKSKSLHRRHVDQLVHTLSLQDRIVWTPGFLAGVQSDPWAGSSITVDGVLRSDLHKHERVIRDLARTAAGEAALEDYIQQVESYWESSMFDFAPVKDTQVIRGWDAILAMCEDHLSALASMKLSPHFALFESVVVAWESKLLALKTLCELWVDVQRRWLYLDGLLAPTSATGADIREQLAVEAARFDSTHREMVALLAKVQECPQVMASLLLQVASQSAQQTRFSAVELRSAALGTLPTKIAAIAEALDRVQKGLAEYLTMTRSSFPRLYFLGDDDCFELLGAAAALTKTGDVAAIARHIQRMFVGISSIKLVRSQDDSGVQLTALLSPEGEEFNLARAVRIGTGTPLVVWLNALSESMRASLSDAVHKDFDSLAAQFKPNDASSNARLGDLLTSRLLSEAQGCSQATLLAFWASWTHVVETALQAAQLAGAKQSDTLNGVADTCSALLTAISTAIAKCKDADSASDRRFIRKAENAIVDVLHKRDVTQQLTLQKVSSVADYGWVAAMRLYTSNSGIRPSGDGLTIGQGIATFEHGYEYYGIGERLVQTPLTDRCYLTLTQALHLKLGGSPFGPAGTGKTETVKALGAVMGRLVLVFNCDESFDFSSMGRILAGLAEAGVWGCFDEFNRLEETVLSAISQQILAIQSALAARSDTCQLMGRQIALHKDVGIFVTMNPGYAGRSQLPDNLKALFRPCAMVVPDAALIARVVLITHGFGFAEDFAFRVTSLFASCAEQLSKQKHYDWGLRALKAVLVTAGQLLSKSSHTEGPAKSLAEEAAIISRALRQSVTPKLSPEDVAPFSRLLHVLFPGDDSLSLTSSHLASAIEVVCNAAGLQHSTIAGQQEVNAGTAFPLMPNASWSSLEMEHVGTPHGVRRLPWTPNAWGDKVLQIFSTACVRHGIMLVGPSGSGKSAALHTLLHAMHVADGVHNMVYTIDPKASPCEGNTQSYKEQMYGHLDATTLEWKDGILTAILRSVVSDMHGEASRRHWIVFDGDVDPEWAENLNSVLDDNRLLTLPSGERIPLPANVRIVFEVENLAHATLATVSRCGMVCFSEDTVGADMLLQQFLATLKNGQLPAIAGGVCSDVGRLRQGHAAHKTKGDVGGRNQAGPSQDACVATSAAFGSTADEASIANAVLAILAGVLDVSTRTDPITPFGQELAGRGRSVEGISWETIMPLSMAQLSSAFLSLVNTQLRAVNVNADWANAEATRHRIAGIAMFALTWACGSAWREAARRLLSTCILQYFESKKLTSPKTHRMAAGLTPYDCDWIATDSSGAPWSSRVPVLELEPKAVLQTSVVVPTVDTLRHTRMLKLWLDSRAPVILCGPPGSGKTLILSSLLAQLESTDAYELVSLSLSSSTRAASILQTLEQHCEYVHTVDGVTLQPRQAPGNKTSAGPRRLILFCDEVNLPSPDRYDTQRAVSLLRQIIECGGFWMPWKATGSTKTATSHLTPDRLWVTLRNVQVVGACNPPTDPGRNPLSPRLLRFAPVILVDYPSPDLLATIYGTLSRAMCKLHPSLKPLAGPLVNASIAVYSANKSKFRLADAPQYVYSPRELSRWFRALYEGLQPQCAAGSTPPPTQVVRLWLHEGMRLFHDRCVTPGDREWCIDTLTSVARGTFAPVLPQGAMETAVSQPVIFSDWLSKFYQSCDLEALRSYAESRAKTFQEEVQNTQIVLFDDALSHILRIDRVLKQPLGHVLLIGASGAGKTLLTKFAAWMQGLAVFSIRITPKYGIAEFDVDLRTAMKQAGVDGTRLVFLVDEANILSSAFLERMNALLASGEIPGLFEGDELATLLQACRAAWTTIRSSTSGATTSAGFDMENDASVYNRFITNVQRNLHIVFTTNPASPAFANRRSTSPALFNRCVVDWFGDWSESALVQVAGSLTAPIDLGSFATSYALPASVKSSSTPAAKLIRKLLQQAVAFRTSRSQHTPDVVYNDAIVTSFVAVHKAVCGWFDDVKGRQGTSGCSAVSPRDFLEFLLQFISLYQDRRRKIEERQLHVSIGLEQIRSTETAVATMKTSLAETQRSLHEKNVAAESKLGQMLKDQQQAEVKKAAAVQLSSKLEQQNKDIAERQKVVETELSAAEPALAAAKQSVQSIGRREMDEVRALPSPPAPVKLVLEAVLVLLGSDTTSIDWAEIRRQLKSADFIPTILGFKTDSLSIKARNLVLDRYINGQPKEFTYERINSASKACGPLYSWVASQVRYSEILERVGPLRGEMMELNASKDASAAQLKETEATVLELEHSIGQYKAEYAELIRDAEVLRQQMNVVKTKVDRAATLVGSLAVERNRWEASSTEFRTHIADLAPECIVGAAFLAYAGSFDYAGRKWLERNWRDGLEDLGILPATSQRSIVDILASSTEKLYWSSIGLPQDEVSIGNAILLRRYRRFPFVIDPSNSSIELLGQLLGPQATGKPAALTRASFLDGAYLKALESACRFGTPILLSDAEKVSPMLYPILNRDDAKNTSNGRSMVFVGDHEVDLSPSFQLVMFSADGNLVLSPDISSRVTVVNFAVSTPSLGASLLVNILDSVMPEVATRRRQVLKNESDAVARLAELEEMLLEQLSSAGSSGSTTSILDDDRMLQSLEALTQQAQNIEKELGIAHATAAQLALQASAYEPVATGVAEIYAALSDLSSQWSALYQYDLPLFLRSIQGALVAYNDASGKHTASTSSAVDFDAAAKLGVVLVRALLDVFGLSMYESHFQSWQLFLASKIVEIIVGTLCAATATSSPKGTAVLELQLLHSLSSSPLLSSPSVDATIAKYQDTWGVAALAYLQDGKAAMTVPPAQVTHIHPVSVAGGQASGWEHEDTALVDLFARIGITEAAAHVASRAPETYVALSSLLREARRVVTVWAVKPTYLHAALQEFGAAACNLYASPKASGASGGGARRAITADTLLGLINERSVVGAKAFLTPLLAYVTPGADVEGQLAQSIKLLGDGIRLRAVAMGTMQSEDAAGVELNAGSRDGSWVVLRNVHLAPVWLHGTLKRYMSSSSLHPQFRIILTMEVPSDSHTPNAPMHRIFKAAPSLRLCRKVLLEPPVGLKHQVARLFKSVQQSESKASHPLFPKISLLLGFLHAVVIERRRYVPAGWTMRYNFGDTDFSTAIHLATHVLQNSPGTDAVQALTTIGSLVQECVYAGRVEKQVDSELLQTIVGHIVGSEALKNSHMITWNASGKEDGVATPSTPPKGTSDLLAWAEQCIPEVCPPHWLGLGEDMVNSMATAAAVHTVRAVVPLLDRQQDSQVREVGVKDDNALAAPLERLVKLLQKIEENTPLPVTNDAVTAAIASQTSALLGQVRSVKREVLQAQSIEAAASGEENAFLSELRIGHVPTAWRPLLMQSKRAGGITDVFDALASGAGRVNECIAHLRSLLISYRGLSHPCNINLRLVPSPKQLVSALTNEASAAGTELRFQVVSNGAEKGIEGVALIGCTFSALNIGAIKLPSEPALKAITGPLSPGDQVVSLPLFSHGEALTSLLLSFPSADYAGLTQTACRLAGLALQLS